MDGTVSLITDLHPTYLLSLSKKKYRFIALIYELKCSSFVTKIGSLHVSDWVNSHVVYNIG
jgi:hypothetical protein